MLFSGIQFPVETLMFINTHFKTTIKYGMVQYISRDDTGTLEQKQL